jgi:dolichol-phosphate mannosyltransferase
LQRLKTQLGARFEVREQSNMGHGQSCLAGYQEACRRKIPFVFQIDSDGQCDPQYFFRFWRARDSCDVIYGVRTKRDDGWRRIVASRVLRITLLMVAGVNCVDANAPYRLMRTEHLQPLLQQIPSTFFLANVALAVLLRRSSAWRHGSVPIRFRERYGGEPSVRLGKFGEKARELALQIKSLQN